MCSCIKFTLCFMFENSMSLCHTDFYFFLFFVWLLISFLFSIWWFSCRCCSVQVKHRMFSSFFVFKSSEYVVYEVRWKEF